MLRKINYLLGWSIRPDGFNEAGATMLRKIWPWPGYHPSQYRFNEAGATMLRKITRNLLQTDEQGGLQ